MISSHLHSRFRFSLNPVNKWQKHWRDTSTQVHINCSRFRRQAERGLCCYGLQVHFDSRVAWQSLFSCLQFTTYCMIPTHLMTSCFHDQRTTSAMKPRKLKAGDIAVMTISHMALCSFVVFPTEKEIIRTHGACIRLGSQRCHCIFAVISFRQKRLLYRKAREASHLSNWPRRHLVPPDKPMARWLANLPQVSTKRVKS